MIIVRSDRLKGISFHGSAEWNRNDQKACPDGKNPRGKIASADRCAQTPAHAGASQKSEDIRPAAVLVGAFNKLRRKPVRPHHIAEGIPVENHIVLFVNIFSESADFYRIRLIDALCKTFSEADCETGEEQNSYHKIDFEVHIYFNS